MFREPHCRRLILSSAALALAVSCASLKIESWMDPEAGERAIGKVMVLGLSDSENIQRRYEDLFVKALGELEVEALAGSALLEPNKRASKEQVESLVKEHAVATVIVTRAVDEKAKVRYEAPIVYPNYYGSAYGFYGWSHSYVHAPGYMRNYTEIHLETNLYDTDTGKMIWSGRKRITDDRSDQSNMELVIKAVVTDLQKRGLLENKAPVSAAP